MPFIEHVASLLLELQDPQRYESIFRVGFYVRGRIKLCVAEEMEEQRRAELQGKEQHFTNVPKDKVSARRVLQSQAEEILFMRHQRMAVGGRREGDEVVR